MLSRSQSVVLIEKSSLVDGIILSVTRTNNSDSSTSNVSETNVESSELGSNDEDDSVRFDRVLEKSEEGKRRKVS